MKHKMESGQRKDKDGNKIPRMIVHSFSATFNGEPVINVALEGAVSTNPYIQFEMTVPETGDLAFKWVDDSGEVTEITKTIKVG